MNFIHKTMREEITFVQFKERFPLTLFPDGYAQDFEDYAPVHPVGQPAHDSAIHKVVRAPAVEVAGSWQEQWEVVPLTQEELAAMASDAATALEAARAEKNAAINAARLAANFSTFTHAGKVFACDQLSRSDIDGTNGYVALHGALPPVWPAGWKAVDNTFYPIADVAAWKAFYGSMFAAGNANFAHAQALKQVLAAAQTIEDVEAIAW
ncbi:DUF4376 domain-containing protein [Ramlibacter sp. H39-3-26]|uniref:DUF4376 domain-containing protein n=1 Tax=Curvibacter soli TaxID=3031331 RepID=UPI0023DBA214|nr:DUF4376 domain-containing protein [Ramlibacter sp. H39-3-26]MDF1486705.1 DUF4376 domain-containing protein [Ramlibacter sp. H39-3-26]